MGESIALCLAACCTRVRIGSILNAGHFSRTNASWSIMSLLTRSDEAVDEVADMLILVGKLSDKRQLGIDQRSLGITA